MKVRDPNELKYNRKYETLLNSFNTLKLILNPNLNDIRKKFLNKMLDIITSQVKIYINLLLSNHAKNVYDILNINNQNLSRIITSFYDNFFKSVNTNINTNENKNIQNKKNKNEILTDNNYDINDKKLIEIELMEEPKPQIYSKLNLDSHNISINKNEIDEKKNNLEIKDEIKVKKNNKNFIDKIKNQKIKDNTNDSFSNNSYIYFVTDSNLSSFKDEKLNLNTDNSIEINPLSPKGNESTREEKKPMEENKYINKKEMCLKENKIHPYYKILGKNKKNFNLKELYMPINKSNKIIKKITQKDKINECCKGILNKAKSDFINEEENKKKYIREGINDNLNAINLKIFIDDFFIPCDSPYGEKLFLIKSTNILIKKSQKDILEKYLKIYFSKEIKSDQSFNSPYLRKVIDYNNFKNKKLLSSLHKYNNKNIMFKNNNLNTINELNHFSNSIQNKKELPSSLQVPFDIIIENILKTININSYKNKEKLINNKISESISAQKLNNKKLKKNFYQTSSNFRKLCFSP